MGKHAIQPLEIFSQLYIGDYFADTLELSAIEHAAFRLLLMRLWLTGTLPERGREFAETAGLPATECGAVRASLTPLLTHAAANIEAWKNAVRVFDGKRLPEEFWRVARAVVLERDGYTCDYCGSQHCLHVDHRIPVTKGGSNSFENLVTSCSSCNLSKGSRSPAQWTPLPSDITPTSPKIWENGRPYKVIRRDLPRDTTMATHSAGILLYRRQPHGLEVFLIHMGGPLWAKKDALAWSIPKGLVGAGEDALAAAKREFHEETGFQLDGQYEPLGTFRQNGKKDLTIWALEGDCDPNDLKSNMFSMVWPPNSGRLRQFPEADHAGWFGYQEAVAKIVKGQQKVLVRFFEQAEQRKDRVNPPEKREMGGNSSR